MKRTIAAGTILFLILSFALSACSSGSSARAATTASPAAKAETKAESTTAAPPASKAETTTAASSAAAAADQTAIPELWPETEMPVSLSYNRMWSYSEQEETKDPKVIKNIVEAIQNIKIGEAVDYAVDDYSDFLLFTFADGHTYQLEFEEENWVTKNNQRLHAEGLNNLRTQLDKLLGEKVQH
ncbi:MAG: hypothetical protein IJT43_08740 [Stomatobaculum sp.]|nr:hypothetical protein [Stomatobaculum sp.]